MVADPHTDLGSLTEHAEVLPFRPSFEDLLNIAIRSGSDILRPSS